MSDLRFNKFKNQFISLRKGEQFCKKCKGRGVVLNENTQNRTPFLASKYLTCSICFGDGKLDWIEKATGKPKTTNMEGQCDCTQSN